MSTTSRQIERYRECLNIIEANADVFPDGFNVAWNGIECYFYGDDVKTQMANAIRALRKATNGNVTKDYSDNAFVATITHKFGEGNDLTFYLRTSRSKVCRKIEEGTEMVEEIDYQKAPKVMVERPIVRWECDPIMDGA